METLLDRFCRYVRIDTQADEKADHLPQLAGPARARPAARRGAAGAGPARRRAGRARHRPGHRPRHRRRTPPRPSPGSPTSIPRRKRAATTSSRSSTRNYDGGDIVLPGDPTQGDPRRRQSGAGRAQGQDDHHHRRHDAARRRRQGRRRRHHGGGRAPAGPPGDPARPDPRLLHLRRGDRPRRRSRRPEEARRRASATRSTAAAPARSTARPSPPTWPSVTITRRQHPPVDRQGAHGQRGAPGRPVPRPAAAHGAVAGDDRRTARASCTRTASRAASPR